MKKNIKNILILLFIILTIISICTITRATKINPDDYKPTSPDMADFNVGFEKGAYIAAVVQMIGTMVSIGTLIVIGIKYVMASADEKAEYKERMLPYFIGAVLLFGASSVVNIIYNIFIS